MEELVSDMQADGGDRPGDLFAPLCTHTYSVERCRPLTNRR